MADDDAHQDTPTHAPLHRALSSQKPKGILKNAPAPPVTTPGGSNQSAFTPFSSYIYFSHGIHSLQWDEQNIALTEAEKESVNRMKITEPKTPFVHSIEDLDEDEYESGSLNLSS